MPQAFENVTWFDLIYAIPVLSVRLQMALGRLDFVFNPLRDAEDACRRFWRRLIRRLMQERGIDDQFRGRQCLDAILKEPNASAEAFQATYFLIIPHRLFAEDAEFIADQLVTDWEAPTKPSEPNVAGILDACDPDTPDQR